MKRRLALAFAVLVLTVPAKAVADLATAQDASEPPSTQLSIGVTGLGLSEVSVGKSRATEEAEKQAAEELAASRKKAAAKAVAAVSRSKSQPVAASNGGSDEARSLARSAVDAKWGDSQWPAFDAIVSRESGWNPNAVNRSSGACGLGQALPCSKMGGMALSNQVAWVIGYMSARYGDPDSAWAFWQSHHWY